MDQLLQQMAEASTQLFHAERASIFLWDRRNKTLVGRPALGIEEGELRIPDDRGIVGQVIQTGQPRMVDVQSESDQKEVYRQVDQQLGYQTRSLLCVPLRGRGGKLLGAFELINKREANFTAEDQTGLIELAAHAAIALENSQTYQRLLTSRQQIVDQAAQEVQLIGSSPVVEQLRSTIARVAGTELAVLLLGENGTGKEVASRAVHYLSRRRNEPFIAVNCAALAESLLESELFGHERGAFTDAHEARPGKFELASGGTLFLDEIGDLSPGGQAKLLRVLEEKIVVRVGGSLPIATDVRVIAATNQDLAELVRQNRFREDLFFRLNVVTLEIPPLRQRGDDILQLAEHFLKQFCQQAGRQPPRLAAAARKSLLRYPWPGNVRELRNLMERLAYLTPGDEVDTDELVFVRSPAPSATPLDLPLAQATRRFQVEYIRRHIEASRGNMTEAAEQLGLHRSNLYRKMRQLGISTDESP
jgi:Nif-specific regulatory protein